MPATLAVTFVGFSAFVIILRQTIGGKMSRLDVLTARIFIQLGFIVAAGAMVPALLSLFQKVDGSFAMRSLARAVATRYSQQQRLKQPSSQTRWARKRAIERVSQRKCFDNLRFCAW
jgi:hypothetical protein